MHRQGKRLDADRPMQRQAASQVVVHTGGGLISVLRCLGEQLHDDSRDCRRHARSPFGGWHGPARDMAMHQFHGIRGRKRQYACDHLVQGHAQRVKIAARIYGAVHPARLLGRHVRKRARNDLRRCWRLALARALGRDAKPGKPDPPGRGVYEHVGRLDVFVNESSSMESAKCGSQRNGQPQKASDLHWTADEAIEGLASGVLDYQHRPPALAHEVPLVAGPTQST